MISSLPRALRGLLVLPTFLVASTAFAQYGGQPGMMPGMPPPGGGMGQEPKEDGPAEAAPEDEERPTDDEPLRDTTARRRTRTPLFELDGYFRLRTDFLHKLSLGQGWQMETGTTTGTPQTGAANLRPPPFPHPLECSENMAPLTRKCASNNLGSGNLRMRLEPIINVTDSVRVLSQIDVLDNTIAGSTPDSLVAAERLGDASGDMLRSGRAPVSSLYTTQDPPEVGKNGWVSSVRAKRAWAEIDTTFGSLRFGRMPWHFGRGMVWNNGACADCDGATTVDRIMALSQIYGFQVMAAWDFGAQGWHAGMIDLGRRDTEAPPLDLSQRDDVFQITGAVLKLDNPTAWRERIGRGEVATNYGLQFVYREQGHENYSVSAPAMTGTGGTNVNNAPPAITREDVSRDLTQNVNALVMIPNLWFKLGWKALTIEFEGSATLGRIERALPLVDVNTASTAAPELRLRQFGWVLASELSFYKNSFFVGFETGGATGDKSQNWNSYLNYRWKTVRQAPGDRTISDFRFSPEYHVDQILFRRILGTVTNAAYFKPQLAYWLKLAEPRELGLSAAAVYSIATEKASTPGNALSYGLELDVTVMYRNPLDGFYAGVTWGVLFPFGALERKSMVNGWQTSEDAETAQVLRTFLGVRF